jgi:predicted XRE-type DNA-binding protein
MVRKRQREEQVTRGSVLDDLGFDPKTSLELKIKAEIHVGILRLIRNHGYTAKQLENVLQIPQSRVSELMNGKLSVLGLSKLAKYADRLNGDIEVRISITERRAA